MSVLIGQASIDEHGRISGGAAGDQSGSELNIRSWYGYGWTLLIRAKDEKIAEKMADYCERIIKSRKAGYDQWQRNTLRQLLKSVRWNVDKLEPCETDCSALMAVCAEAAGVDMSKAYKAGNAPATFQMRQQYAKTGAFDLLTDNKYLSSDKYLCRGDILVHEQHHTCMVLTDGAKGGDEREMVEKSKIIVDGKEVPVERILKNNTNYIKIRDLAAALGLKVGFQGNIATLDSKK
ncbi:MAG: hypothetical protein MJ014_00285 [Methanocorpusculum sp.]|nr:hypothetical protein [Methanocorpusculum sp.]